ncbi:MAG: M28 family peptidase [Bacteroidales bacterium]|nr:M28 family peptidase [Bacteroidales bacterium]
MKKTMLLATALTVALTISAQINSTKQWVMMPERTYDYIVGEASGERALRSIMDLASYERNRTDAEYKGTLHEISYIMKMLHEYGLDNIRLENVAKADTWNGISASLWEVSPTIQKIADYDELVVMLASGSENADVEAELVWVSLENIRNTQPNAELAGKIVLTDAPVSMGHAYAQANGGLGVVSFYSSRFLFDPIQIPNAGIGSRGGVPANPAQKALFGFNITPRQGFDLKSRLLGGDKIKVQAKVQSNRVQFDIPAIHCSIKGSDPNAGSIIFSAHLFEGYNKLGANDNASGSAVILEVARTLKTLIDKGLIERPKRSMHFVWGDEFRATGPWASNNRDITESALCNINLDMVGINLKDNNSYYTLHRTTYGNPHYINDVAENFFIYMGETNRNSILAPARGVNYIKPVVAPSGTDDTFVYAISEHYGASDHEVFNDWGIQVPGIIMITWPDPYYHTSEDRVDKMDATQLKRATVLAAATAYTIAVANQEGALRIGAEVVANANKRLGFYQIKYIDMIANATDVDAAYRHAVFAIEGHAKNEKNTLATVQELTPDNKAISDYIKKGNTSIDKTTANIIESLKIYAEVRAGKPMKITLSPAEIAASRNYPVQTSKPKEMRYGALNRAQESFSIEERMELRAKLSNPADIARMTNSGNNSVLDIHKMMLAQHNRILSLEEINNFLSMLEKEGYVKMVKK